MVQSACCLNVNVCPIAVVVEIVLKVLEIFVIVGCPLLIIVVVAVCTCRFYLWLIAAK